MNFENLNTNSPNPLYQQISSIIKEKIVSRKIPVNQKLPPEQELSSIFHVNVLTVRAALAGLVEEGLIVRKQNRGTFVISAEPKKASDLKPKDILCFVICTGALIRTIESPYFHNYISGAENTAGESGMRLLCKTLKEGDDELFIKENDIAGLIVAGNITPSHFKAIKRTRLPFVLIGDVLQGSLVNSADVVTNEDSLDTYMAARYLISLGHRKIAYLANFLDKFPWNVSSLKGYQQALEESGILYDAKLAVESGSREPEAVCSIVNRLLNGARKSGSASLPFSGMIIAPPQTLATGALKAFKNANLRVPEDISVVTSDESPGGMTRISYNPEEVGGIAAERLMKRLAEPELEPERIIIRKKLITGESTRKIKNRTVNR